ncbi:hypothetical protein FHS10_002608 [Mucilaginibacter dorajii]|nr:hypothetical protein [Mucilaginibacter dorajii]
MDLQLAMGGYEAIPLLYLLALYGDEIAALHSQ